MQQSSFTPIADGCFRDTSRLLRDEQGQLCWLEFTPILNPDNTLTPAKARALAEKCELAGGGWRATTAQEEFGLRNLAKYEPASDIPGDPDSGYVITSTDEVSPPSGFVWAVTLLYGYVAYVHPDDNGFVRGGRLVPASQEDLAVGLTK
jgi:hypothetical protein